MKETKSGAGVRVAPLTLVRKEIFCGAFAEQEPHLAKALTFYTARPDEGYPYPPERRVGKETVRA